jgi:hypothetical protein
VANPARVGPIKENRMSSIASPLTNPLSRRDGSGVAATIEQHGRVRRALVESLLAVVLLVAAVLLQRGGSFGSNMVRDQLAAQRITFPAANSPALDAKTYPGLQRYGGQVVNSGPKAKAYANQFIATHLKGVNNAKTYSETSTEARAARAAADAATKAKAADASALEAKATALEGQTQTLFRGETLRGLLLYAWGWSVVSRIATLASIASFVAAALLAALAAWGFQQSRGQLGSSTR